VYCKETKESVNTPKNRAEFLRRLYNLRHMVEKDGEIGNTNTKIEHLQREIKKLGVQTFYSNNKRKRTGGGDAGDRGTGGNGRARGGGGRDCAEDLETHGYKVEPQDIVDEKGYVVVKSQVRQPLSTYAPR
jgi:hypothetical protein